MIFNIEDKKLLHCVDDNDEDGDRTVCEEQFSRIHEFRNRRRIIEEVASMGYGSVKW